MCERHAGYTVVALRKNNKMLVRSLRQSKLPLWLTKVVSTLALLHICMRKQSFINILLVQQDRTESDVQLNFVLQFYFDIKYHDFIICPYFIFFSSARLFVICDFSKLLLSSVCISLHSLQDGLHAAVTRV